MRVCIILVIVILSGCASEAHHEIHHSREELVKSVWEDTNRVPITDTQTEGLKNYLEEQNR